MVDILAELIKTEIENLDFVDTIAGLVRPLIVPDNEAERTIPVDVNENITTCNPSALTDLVPNSDKKSVIYFEDEGTQTLERYRRQTRFETTLRLVCWCNYDLINTTYVDPRVVQSSLIGALPATLTNQDYITGIKLNLGGFLNRDDIFDKYDYEEVRQQFMTYPYDAFAIDLQIQYYIPNTCVSNVSPNPTSCP